MKEQHQKLIIKLQETRGTPEYKTVKREYVELIAKMQDAKLEAKNKRDLERKLERAARSAEKEQARLQKEEQWKRAAELREQARLQKEAQWKRAKELREHTRIQKEAQWKQSANERAARAEEKRKNEQIKLAFVEAKRKLLEERQNTREFAYKTLLEWITTQKYTDTGRMIELCYYRGVPRRVARSVLFENEGKQWRRINNGDSWELIYEKTI